MTGVLLYSKKGVLTKTCAKSENEVTGMERYDEEEEKAKEAYEKHKCKTCVWSK
jgi:tRNA/tmRNA/rRNA uracil-C5-methylase (TrmA/RlmC/RlmD family)